MSITDTFSWPVPDHTITNGYGTANPHSSSGGPHTGVDFRAAVGTQVVASRAGTVLGVYDLGGSSYGKYIIIDHGDGRRSLYAHLSQFQVANGQKVAEGQNIALTGQSGKVTGPHLHFEIRQGNRPINPIPFLGDKDLGEKSLLDKTLLGAASGLDKATPDNIPNPFGWVDDILGWIQTQALRVGLFLGGFSMLWIGFYLLARNSPAAQQIAGAVATRGMSLAGK